MDQLASELHHDDLAWARALAGHDATALERYERELVPMIEIQLRRRGFTVDEIADLQQILRLRILVGEGDGGSIASYEGRGALRSWVLVAALREAIRVRQRHRREPALDDDALFAFADRAALRGDSESAVGKEDLRAAFRHAFRAALTTLTPRDRTLLRMNILDELSIDQIGVVHGIHRATAARWIEKARERVARAVRRDVMRQLGVDRFEVRELLHWIESKIELSLEGIRDRSTTSEMRRRSGGEPRKRATRQGPSF